MDVRTIWIEEGCILCNACTCECPQAFVIGANSCEIRQDVRADGHQDENRDAHAPLKAEWADRLQEGIRRAVSACPVEVIKIA